jgi:hypothetical protein
MPAYWLDLTRKKRVVYAGEILSEQRPGGAARIVSAVVPFIVGVLAFSAFGLARHKAAHWNTDDAAITYVYAQALADRASGSAYTEGPSVEGYSNPLLVAIVASLRLLGIFDPISTHLNLEAALFALATALVFVLVRPRCGAVIACLASILFAATELMTPSTWLWYGSGLENALLTAALVLLVCRAENAIGNAARPLIDGPVAFLLVLVRPEGALYVVSFFACLLCVAFLDRHKNRGSLRAVAATMGVAIVLVVAFVTLRLSTFGDLLPNTYYAKLQGTGLMKHFREYVIADIVPYRFTYISAIALGALLAFRRGRTLGLLLVLLFIASAMMPAWKGADWMGEHRFATQLFAVGHLGLALFVATTLCHFRRSRLRTPVYGALALAVGSLLLGLHRAGNPILSPPRLHEVTIGLVAHLQGALRLDHQRRLGLINPTIILPDAGGSQWIGSFRMLDSGRLTDFHLARIFANGGPLAEVNRYQHEEQLAEMADDNRISYWSADPNLIASRFLRHPDLRMRAREDLVRLSQVPPGAVKLGSPAGCHLYLSNGTVPLAGPGGLVRVEIVVERPSAAAARSVRLVARSGNDSDDVSLTPYGDNPGPGIERRAFVLGIPDKEGFHKLSLEIIESAATTVIPDFVTFEVRRDAAEQARAARRLVNQAGIGVGERARRFAVFLQQSIPRLTHTQWRREADGLRSANIVNSGAQSRHLRNLVWDARLASAGTEGKALREISDEVVSRVVAGARCSKLEAASQLLCLGQVVQWLRSQGYFGVADRGDIRTAAENALASLDGDSPILTRYQALVGLTLLWPARMNLQKDLYELRGQLPHAWALPRHFPVPPL